MKTQWPQKSLCDLLEINESGIWGDEGGKNDFPVLRSSNIQGGRLDLEDVAYREISHKKVNRYKLEDGDILVTKSSGSAHLIGKTCLFNNPDGKTYLFSNFTQRLRPQKGLLDSRFLFYYLNSPAAKATLRKISNTTSGLRNLNLKDYGEQLVPIPPLSVQKRIAAILEKADAAREKRRQASRLTEEFLRSAFLEMFGDPVRNPKGWPTGLIADAIRHSEYGTSEKSNGDKRGYPILGMGNVTTDGQLDLDNLSYVDLPRDEFERLKLRKGDVIFNRTNSTELVGKTAYWDRDFDAVIASYLVKLQLTKDFNSIWFSCFLNTSYYKMLFRQRCRKAVGQSNISPTLLKELPLFIPPISEQNKFAALVEKVEVLRAKQKQSERELDDLFHSLMQRAFRGELAT